MTSFATPADPLHPMAAPFAVPPFTGLSQSAARASTTPHSWQAGPYVPAAWRATPAIQAAVGSAQELTVAMVPSLAPTPVRPLAALATPPGWTPTTASALAETVGATDDDGLPWIDQFLANTPLAPMDAISGPPDAYRYATPASSFALSAPTPSSPPAQADEDERPHAGHGLSDLRGDVSDEFAAVLADDTVRSQTSTPVTATLLGETITFDPATELGFTSGEIGTVASDVAADGLDESPADASSASTSEIAWDMSDDVAIERSTPTSVDTTTNVDGNVATDAATDAATGASTELATHVTSDLVSDVVSGIIEVPDSQHVDLPTPPMGTPLSLTAEPFAPTFAGTFEETLEETFGSMSAEMPAEAEIAAVASVPPYLPPYVPPAATPARATTPMDGTVIEPWPLEEAADALDEIARGLGDGDLSHGHKPARFLGAAAAPAPLPAWSDEDMMDIMPMHRATPTEPVEEMPSLDHSAESADASAQAAAQALEMLAQRVRAGELQLPGYDPRMGDAAALVSALAALLGLRLG